MTFSPLFWMNFLPNRSFVCACVCTLNSSVSTIMQYIHTKSYLSMAQVVTFTCWSGLPLLLYSSCAFISLRALYIPLPSVVGFSKLNLCVWLDRLCVCVYVYVCSWCTVILCTHTSWLCLGTEVFSFVEIALLSRLIMLCRSFDLVPLKWVTKEIFILDETHSLSHTLSTDSYVTAPFRCFPLLCVRCFSIKFVYSVELLYACSYTVTTTTTTCINDIIRAYYFWLWRHCHMVWYCTKFHVTKCMCEWCQRFTPSKRDS